MKIRTTSNQVDQADVEDIISMWARDTESVECEELAERMMGYYMMAVAISAGCKKRWRDDDCVGCVLHDFSWVCPRIDYKAR